MPEVFPTKYAEQLTDWLVDMGYTHCFFVAGGNIMHLLDGARSRFRCVPVVHEVAAGIAVEYFNEASDQGKAFALVTAGPGLTNILTAMAGAWLESRELLVIGGQVKSEDLRSGGVRQRGIQEVDGASLAAPVCKRSVLMVRPWERAEFEATVSEGFADRPGPVFVEVCLDVQGAAPVPETENVVATIAKQTLSPSELASVAEYVATAERPLLLLGGGVSRESSHRLQEAFAALGMPIMTTWNGADRLDSSDPLYVGRPNTWGQRAANLLVAQCDLLVAVGTRLGLQQTGFNWREFASRASIIHVDVDSSELQKGHPLTDLPLAVDANHFLEYLVTLPKKVGWAAWLGYCQEVRSLLPSKDPENVTADGFVCPYDFYLQLSELALSEDILIPCSSGGANSVAMQTINQKAGQVIITDKGLASMGYGLSGAIGAAFSHPDRRVLMVEGDGGFTQNLQELATVGVNSLNLKIFIFANEGYASIRTTQRNYFGGAYLGCDTQTGLGFPQWLQLFASYGIPTAALNPNWAVVPEVREMLDSRGPAAFVVPIDPLQTYWPKITSRITESGSMESNPLHMMSPDLSPDLFARVSRYLVP